METCSICLEDVSETERHLTPCSHTFHLACMNAWLRFKHTCPTCRSQLDSSNVVIDSQDVDHDDDDLVQYYFESVEEIDDENDVTDSDESQDEPWCYEEY